MPRKSKGSASLSPEGDSGAGIDPTDTFRHSLSSIVRIDRGAKEV